MKLRVTAEVEIDRPAPAVFAAVTDVAHQPEWSSAVEKVSDITDEPPLRGTTWTQVTRLLGRVVEVHARVVGCEQDALFAYRVDRPAPVQMTWRLEPAANGTHVSVVAEGDAGLFAALVKPMLGALREALEGDLGRLKRRLEVMP